MEAGKGVARTHIGNLFHDGRNFISYRTANTSYTLTNAELKHIMEHGGKSLVLPNRLLNNSKTPRREMMRLDADPGGSRVRFIIDVFLHGMQHPSLVSPGEGPS